VVGAVAAACALAIAAPFALRGGGSPTPPAVTPSTPSTPQLRKGALSGDLDGDGTPDIVRISAGGMLRIDLGSGTALRRQLSGNPVLEGLTRIAAGGLAVATSTRASDRMDGRVWSIRRVDGTHLVRVPFAARAVIGSQPGLETSWIGADLRLDDGSLDPLQRGEDHVVVVTRTWTRHDGHLTHARSGVWCWDRSGSQPPAPCATGQDWSYDVGPRADLPALLPTAGTREAGPGGIVTPDGYAWSLRRATPLGSVESANYDLVVKGGGTTQSIAVPAGWAPAMYRTPARIGDLTQGVILSQEGGDSDTWRVYVRWGGQVQQLQTQGPVGLGGGFTSGGMTAYLSWMSADGSLYTRFGTPRPGHFHVYAWMPTGVSASTAPVLAAQDLGVVCIDQTLDTYGTCPG
jgi:hypothetical protein